MDTTGVIVASPQLKSPSGGTMIKPTESKTKLIGVTQIRNGKDKFAEPWMDHPLKSDLLTFSSVNEDW